jgi:protein HIRA/HIR1
VLKQYNYRPAVNRAQRVPPPPPRPLDPTPNAPANGFGAPAIGGGSHINVLQPKKGKPAGQKRRINLGADRPAARNPFSSPGGANGGDAFSSAPIQPLGSPLKARNAMFNDDTTGFSSDMNGAGPSRLGYKRKADFGDDDSRQGLGQSVQSTIAAKDLREPRFPTSHAGPGPSSRSLPLPRVQTILRVSATYPCDPTAYLEAQNAESASGRNKVLYSQGGQDQWVDYLPSAVIVMVATDRFTAVGCEDGSLVVCSLSGTQ